MKKIFAIALSLALTASLAACGSKPAEQPAEEPPVSSSEASAETERPQNIPGGSVQIANPYVTCKDAAEMQQQAGLEITLPDELPGWVSETIYRAMPEKLIEVIYKNEDNEIRVRAANGSDDISGVYDSDHSYNEDITVDGKTVHAKGETDADKSVTLFVCTWTAEGKTYSVTSPNGVPEAEMLQVVEAVR